MTIGISKERIQEKIDEISKDFNLNREWNLLVSLLEECEELNPWLPIEEDLKEGIYPVYLPEENRKLQFAYINKNINIIGNNFAVDLTKPTLYLKDVTPLP